MIKKMKPSTVLDYNIGFIVASISNYYSQYNNIQSEDPLGMFIFLMILLIFSVTARFFLAGEIEK